MKNERKGSSSSKQPKQPAQTTQPKQPAQIKQTEQVKETAQPKQAEQSKQTKQPTQPKQPAQTTQTEQVKQIKQTAQPKQPEQVKQPKQPAQTEQPIQGSPLLATAALRLAYAALHLYCLLTTKESERHNDLSRKTMTLLQGVRTRSKAHKEWESREQAGEFEKIEVLEDPVDNRYQAYSHYQKERNRKARKQQKSTIERLTKQKEGSDSYNKLLSKKNDLKGSLFLSAPIDTAAPP